MKELIDNNLNEKSILRTYKSKECPKWHVNCHESLENYHYLNCYTAKSLPNRYVHFYLDVKNIYCRKFNHISVLLQGLG